MSYGASPSAPNKQGKTPLDYALEMTEVYSNYVINALTEESEKKLSIRLLKDS
jgi:hypothetical protein